MSCNYFILNKPTKDIQSDDHNYIVSLNSNNYILPKNNIKYYIDYGLFEKSLINWCKQFGNLNKIFLDIGAHTGTYTISLADVFHHTHAFEPQKMTYYALCGSIALSNLNNVTCHQYGLGSSEQIGNQTLNIVSDDGGGSSLHINNHKILKTEQIEIKTLDSLCIDNIGFIKMDIEENELQCLQGAVDTLKKSNYPKILFEMNIKNFELISFLKNLGYNLISINGYPNMYLAEH